MTCKNCGGDKFKDGKCWYCKQSYYVHSNALATGQWLGTYSRMIDYDEQYFRGIVTGYNDDIHS